MTISTVDGITYLAQSSGKEKEEEEEATATTAALKGCLNPMRIPPPYFFLERERQRDLFCVP